MITVFFDLDGVLANFVQGALRKHKREDIKHADVGWGIEAQLGLAPEVFWSALSFSFWADLEPYADGMQLLHMTEKLVGPDHIGILTSPCDTAGCVDGKRSWVERYLPLCYKRQLFVGSAKHLFAGPGKILVDDHDKNAVAFQEAGGRIVVPPRPWNGLKVLTREGGFFDPDVVFRDLQGQVKAVREGK